jgi:predicted CopG family antitoxin
LFWDDILCTYTYTGDAIATKTISIDLEAYKRLKARKAEGESLSQTIKRLVPMPFDSKKWLDEMAANPVSEEFVAAVERTIASRRAPQNMRGYDDVSRHNRSDRSTKVKAKPASASRRSKNK